MLLLLSAIAWLALAFGGFLDAAPNRLARATAIPLSHAPLIGTLAIALALALLTIAGWLPQPWRRPCALFGAGCLLLASLDTAGSLARLLTSPAAPAARYSLGPGFWIPAAIALLAIVQVLQAPRTPRILRIIVPLVLVIALAGLVVSGRLAHLSLAREFATQQTAFVAAFVQHVFLVAASLVFALLVGLPLSLLVLRKTAARTIVFSTLNILQTIPSIAIFGLLLAPLSMLAERLPWLARMGITGTGAAPAIIALTLYALLPLVRNFSTGIEQVSNDVRDAARGLGFDKWRIFFEVELPLALPALVSGLRIVTVQSIGLAAVAALIGAGGLGTFVFEGIGEYALDLVLLGSLPIILLALMADYGFRLLQTIVRSAA